MLFLIRVEVSANEGQVGSLLEKIEREWQIVAELKRDGPILACGKLEGVPGAVAIFDVEDRERVDGIVESLPLAPFFSRVVVEPLISAEQALRQARLRRRAYERYEQRRRDHGGLGPNGKARPQTL